MSLRTHLLAGYLLAAASMGCTSTGGLAQEVTSTSPPTPISAIPSIAPCPVTIPNGSTPPRQTPGSTHHGTGALWTALWPEGKILASPSFVSPDGSIRMKFPWWTTVRDQLTIQGRRLDAPAPPLQAEVPTNDVGGFFATAIFFPSEGCWEIVGKVGDVSLTFVNLVVKVGE